MNIPRANIPGGIYPLSSAQSRIWFMENLNDQNRAYNDPYDYRVKGKIDPVVLEKSIRILMIRHESFRTVFRNENGSPHQVVLPSAEFSLDQISLVHEDPATREQTVAKHSLANSQKKFDLEKGPLFYVGLIKLQEDEHVLLINFHHIISDAVSIRIFLDELFEVYHAEIRKKPAELPEIPITYRDYAVWENEWLRSEECMSQINYWKKELEGIPDNLQMPFDFARPHSQRFKGAEYYFRVDEKLRLELSNLSKRHGTSLLIPMLSAFAVLLSKYSLQNDLVIGVPVANRSREELQMLVGVLINSLPMRFQLRQDSSFVDLIESTRTRFMMAYENKGVPFERLVEELKIRRSLNSSPIFQVLFNYLTAFEAEIRYPDVVLQQLPGERNAALVDLTLTVLDQKTWANCVIQYDTDLFGKETIERMAGHYLTILKTVASHDPGTIGKIPLLTDKEKEQILIEWNRTPQEYPRDACIHQIFEEQVAKTPDAIAVEDDQVSYTYDELNRRSNRLASWLRKKGASEDASVALFVERNADMLTGILGIVKSGATLLPLDPLYPSHRIDLILRDAKPVLVLASRTLAGQVPETEAEMIFLDDQDNWKNEPETNPGFGDPQKLAYILFTSGSTGKPKGVKIKHHSVVNLVSYFRKALAVTSRDVLLSVTTIAFDIAELEMYLPVCSGAKLVIASRETVLDMSLLMEKIAACGATLFQATPVTYKMLLMNGWNGKAGLKVICGGEALSRELARELQSRCEEVWNGYGPTETTIYSVARKLTREDTTGEGFSPIGYPIDNTLVYVLNQDRIPVPVGIPGELYIGGDGVSPGYVNLPEITELRFIPDHLSRKAETKLYKTGDIVKYYEDGRLVFLNRVDSQVKIRGFRIELGEIESVISQYHGIVENVVAVKEDPAGEKMLVSYYIATQEDIDVGALRLYVKERLPDYMIPAAFVRMEQFPLTANNKIDRNLLPEPDLNMKSTVIQYVKPETPTEIKLAVIWESILKTEKISANEDFFEAGGHSMIAVTLIIKIEKEFGVRIPLASLFEKSTIQGMAKLIDAGISASGEKWRSLVPVRPEGKSKPLFLVQGLGLNAHLYTSMIRHLDPDQPVYLLQAKGLNGKERPLDSVEAIADHYVREILSVDPEGPYILAGHSFGGKIAYEMARQLVGKGKTVSFLGLIDSVAEEPETGLKISGLISNLSVNIRHLFGGEDDTDETISFGTGKESPREFPAGLKEIRKANKKAAKNFVIRPYTGQIHLFKAKQNKMQIKDKLTYGWNKYAGGGVIVHEIPGDHAGIYAPPADKYFADVLQRHLSLNQEKAPVS